MCIRDRGEEVSYFLIVDKKSYKFFGSAQDHKKVGERDKGPNTGGMGAYSPSRLISVELEEKILELGAENVAAFVAEPILASGGVVIPPKGYHKRTKTICEAL